MSIVCLGGGIGATRLWRALAAEAGQERLTVIVNTADDLWHYGLRVSPDVDTVIYGLSGAQDQVRGWGLIDESFRSMETLALLGEDVWFNLGDRDLATHLLRTKLLRQGLRLTDIVGRIAAARGLTATILPMSDTEVGTEVLESGGTWVSFQEFHVKHRSEPDVEAVRYTGIEDASSPPEVLGAIESASLIVIGPSSPVASVLPILGVGSTREAIRHSRAPVVAVSPVVSGSPISDPGDAHRARSRQRLMASQGIAHRASDVADLYRDVLDHFVVDDVDADEAPRIESVGVRPIVAPTLTHVHPQAGPHLCRALLDLALNVRERTEPGIARG